MEEASSAETHVEDGVWGGETAEWRMEEVSCGG